MIVRHLLKYQNRFYDELFFPYIKENNITTLIHLGDVVDRRKFINHNTAHNFKKVFFNKLEELNIDTHIIIGNHDTYYKNTNEVNALQNLDINKGAKLYTKTTEVEFDNLPILFILGYVMITKLILLKRLKIVPHQLQWVI